MPCTLNSMWSGWCPGDTLLHWAVRRGSDTSDEMLLALLQAGYDPDAPNLGCPCCCSFSSTAREMAVGSHAALLLHLSDDAEGVGWGKIEWVNDVPCRVVDGDVLPLDTAESNMDPTVIDPFTVSLTGRCGSHRVFGSYPLWGPLVSAVHTGRVSQVKKLTNSVRFDVNRRPTSMCCGASSGRCESPYQCWWYNPLAYLVVPCAVTSMATNWCPGDTLLHWAVRRGSDTSDEMLLALLQAGYDPDAPNLGCPCCCSFSSTAREMAVGSHAALLTHVVPKSVDQILWHENVACTRGADRRETPLPQVNTTPTCNAGLFGSENINKPRVSERVLSGLVRAITADDVARLKHITSPTTEFNYMQNLNRHGTHYRPVPFIWCSPDTKSCHNQCQCWWYFAVCSPCCWCSYCPLVLDGWCPGDTLLHWAVRRGSDTSDEMLLALLQAGYDPDTTNLGCCCCCAKDTPRSIVNSGGVRTHVDLLAQVVAPSMHDAPVPAPVYRVREAQAQEATEITGVVYVD